MRVIGIVGGIASGKSVVAQRLAQLGAAVISADQLGHDVLHEPEVRRAIGERWGTSVLNVDGSINRSAVAALVFSDTPEQAQNLEFLENLTHPRIRRLTQQAIENYRRQGIPAVVLDAALLYEKNWHELCDSVLFVDTPDNLRRERAKARGWSMKQFDAREAAQAPLAEKRQRADGIIDNSRDLQYVHQQVDRWWQENFPEFTTRTQLSGQTK